MEVSTLWLAVSQTFLAIGMLFVAWQQYQLRHKEFRHSLYEKRFNVFKEVKRYLSKAVTRNDYVPDEGFWDAMVQSDFIFEGPEISKYLNEIYSNMIKLQSLDQEIFGRSSSEDGRCRQLHEKRTIHFDWLVRELKEHPIKFKRYLSVLD